MLITKDSDSLATSGSRTLRSGSGAYAELAADSRGESLKVFSTKQQLLFEFDVASGKTTVHVPSGDLEFVTNDGDIIFTSARTISLRAHTLHVTSRATIQLAISDVVGKIRSALTLQSQRTKLCSPELSVTARRSELQMEEVNCAAKTLSGRVESARLVIGKLERIADSVIERARNVYTTVEGVFQLKAGRMRTMLDGTYHFKARRAYLRAQEDFKVNADKIHLG